MGAILHQGDGLPVVRLPALSGAGGLLSALSADLPDGQLYQPGAGIVGRWMWDGSAPTPCGPIDLTKAAWGHATVAAGSGTSYTLDALPTTPDIPLGTSGTCRCMEAGVAVGADVGYSRVGTALALDSARVMTAGAVVLEVVGGRTGVLDFGAAGDVRPLAGAQVLPLGTGLKVKNGSCVLALGCFGMIANWRVTASITLARSASADNQYAGLGPLLADDHSAHFAELFARITGSDRMRSSEGAVAAPAFHTTGDSATVWTDTTVTVLTEWIGGSLYGTGFGLPRKRRGYDLNPAGVSTLCPVGIAIHAIPGGGEDVSITVADITV